MSQRFPKQVLTLLLLALITGGVARAGDDLTPTRQAALLVSVLPYDRHFKTRAERTIRIGVLWRDGNANSSTYALDMVSALRDLAATQPLKGITIQVVTIPYSGVEDLEQASTNNPLTALYVCPGLGDSISAIAAITRRTKTLTFSSRETEVRNYLSIGFLRRGTKPSLLLNVRAAGAEGADLEPELLAVGEVLR